MVSPRRLRLLTDLAEGTVEEVTPTLTENGNVTYPPAERSLAVDGREAAEALASLAERGLLNERFQEKVYLCPVCGAEGMRYTTACGNCSSPHTLLTEVVEHADCRHVDHPEAFEATDEDDPRCPECGELLTAPEDTRHQSLYVCRECGDQSETAEHALRCSACDAVRSPEDGVERALYRYALSKQGRRWLDRQLAARDALVAALEGRGFDVAADTTVAAGKTEHPVHVHATDELLGDAVVAAVHEHPGTADVEALLQAADSVNARAFLLTTTGGIDTGAAALVDEREVQVMAVGDDGDLRREYDVTTNSNDGGTFIQRLTSAFRQRDAG